MHHHLTKECPGRVVKCPQGCGQAIPAAKMGPHLESACLMRVRSCTLGCGAMLQECHMSAHQEQSCPQREVFCPICGDHIVQADLERHKSEEGPGGCQFRLMRCRLGCGLLLKQRQLAAHMEKDCPKRYVTCLKCGDDRVWADELAEQHPERDCSERIVICPHENCGLGILAKHLEEHVTKICGYRLIRCDCGDDVTAAELDFHRRIECQAALRYCTLGCGLKVSRTLSEERPRYRSACNIDMFLMPPPFR